MKLKKTIKKILTGNSTDLKFLNWGNCFLDPNKKLIKKRKVQSGCTDFVEGLYQIVECFEKEKQKVNKEIPYTDGAFDRKTGQIKSKKNESCYPFYLLIVLIVYSTISTFSCCWIFLCLLTLKKRTKKENQGKQKLKLKLNYENDYQNVNADEV